MGELVEVCTAPDGTGTEAGQSDGAGLITAAGAVALVPLPQAVSSSAVKISGIFLIVKATHHSFA